MRSRIGCRHRERGPCVRATRLQEPSYRPCAIAPWSDWLSRSSDDRQIPTTPHCSLVFRRRQRVTPTVRHLFQAFGGNWWNRPMRCGTRSGIFCSCPDGLARGGSQPNSAVVPVLVVPAKAGTKEFQSLAPWSPAARGQRRLLLHRDERMQCPRGGMHFLVVLSARVRNRCFLRAGIGSRTLLGCSGIPRQEGGDGTEVANSGGEHRFSIILCADLVAPAARRARLI